MYPTPRTHYLNADFDLSLRPRPRQIEQPALIRQVHELSVQAVLGADPGDAALVRVDVPPEFIEYLGRSGIETPRLLAHPEIDAATTLRPFGWSREAIDLNRRHGQRAEHPSLATIRKVNARSFGRFLEEAVSSDPPQGAVVETSQELDAFLAGVPPESAWVVKAEHGHSGLSNRRLHRPRLDAADRRFVAERFAEDDRLLVERWLPRERDYCVVFEVPFDGTRWHVHEIMNTSDGALVGAMFDPESRNPAVRDELLRVSEQIASHLSDEGYFGPVCLDAFEWRDGDRLRLRPLVDLNCRLAMSDGARRLWSRIAPGSVFYYRFFNRRKLRLPDDMQEVVNSLGDNAYDPALPRGILLASPLRVGREETWRQPTKLAVIFVGSGRREVVALEDRFRRKFEL